MYTYVVKCERLSECINVVFVGTLSAQTASQSSTCDDSTNIADPKHPLEFWHYYLATSS